MRTWQAAALCAALAAVIGCKTQRDDSMAVVAAPEPVVIEPEPMTMRFDEPAPPAPASVQSPAPAPQPAPIATAPTTGPGSTYVVQRKDTLYGIAKRYYGTGKAVNDILAANPQIADPNRIYVGQRIELPLR